MDKVTQLQQALVEAQKEAEDKRISDLLKENSKWVGKCYSSHLFHRLPANGKEITLRRITAVEYTDNRVYYVGQHINFMYHPKRKAFKVEINDRWRTDSPFPSWISSFSHEITEGLFEQVYNEVQIHADTYFTKISGLFKQNEYISQGDHSNERSKIHYLTESGFSFITMKGLAKDVLSWQNHPFLYGYDQLLNTRESIEMVKTIADNMEASARQWGYSIWERDRDRVEALRSFYNQQIKSFKK